MNKIRIQSGKECHVVLGSVKQDYDRREQTQADKRASWFCPRPRLSLPILQ
jgi:hypothetical protein